MRVANAKALVLLNETGTRSGCVPTGPFIDEHWQEAIADHLRVNGEPRRVLSGRDIGVSYAVSSREDVDSLMSKDPTDALVQRWDGYYRRHPDSGGFIQLSAVGFDRLRTRAVVYVAHSCDVQCGGGTYHLLEKNGTDWRLLLPREGREFSACAIIA
jgi:hypothetical protein